MSLAREQTAAGGAQVLYQVIEEARALGNRAVVAFDLDSTLFDNRPRQARILREFGAARNVAPLAGCAAAHWDSGWDMKAAMRNCGVAPDEVERLYPEAKQFWQERFFTSEYCSDDVAIRGAAEFVRAVAGTGATVCYVTGRHKAMRRGTVQAMRKCGLPLPGRNVHLILKPTIEMGDDEFKREAHRELAKMGKLIAAFDNEPAHVNDYRQTFPEATIVHLATDHSGRPVTLLEGIATVADFGASLDGTACSSE